MRGPLPTQTKTWEQRILIVVLDTETTGLDHKSDAIVELAAVGLVQTGDGWTLGPSFSSLVSPGRRVPPEARAVHHLSDEQLRDAPHLPIAMREMYLEMGAIQIQTLRPAELILAENPEDGLRGVGARGEVVQDCGFGVWHWEALAAHNMAFDWGFLGPHMTADTPIPRICTWRCAMHLYPDFPSHKNQELRYRLPRVDAAAKQHLSALTEPLAPHRALYDTIVTACLLAEMLREHEIRELMDLSVAQVLQKTVRFGKHRGVKWAEVPKSYLTWLTTRPPAEAFDADVVHTARHHLGLGPVPKAAAEPGDKDLYWGKR